MEANETTPQRAPSLAVIVPATDGPPTLERCVEAIRAAVEPPRRDRRRRPPARGGRRGGPERRCRPRQHGHPRLRRLRRRCCRPEAFSRMRRSFAADPGCAAVFGSYDDDPRPPGTVSSFRNLLHHHVHPAGGGAATLLGGARRGSPGRVPPVGGSTSGATPASIEDIELGDPSRARRRAPARSGAARHSPEALDAAPHGADRLLSPRRSLGSLLLRERTGTQVLNLGWRHRLSALPPWSSRRRCWCGASGSRSGRRGRVARAQPLVLRRSCGGGAAHVASIGVALHALHLAGRRPRSRCTWRRLLRGRASGREGLDRGSFPERHVEVQRPLDHVALLQVVRLVLTDQTSCRRRRSC